MAAGRWSRARPRRGFTRIMWTLKRLGAGNPMPNILARISQRTGIGAGCRIPVRNSLNRQRPLTSSATHSSLGADSDPPWEFCKSWASLELVRAQRWQRAVALGVNYRSILQCTCMPNILQPIAMFLVMASNSPEGIHLKTAASLVRLLLIKSATRVRK
jgi:hypothetical protein